MRLTALLSPQHGFAGEKQDDMVESADAYHSANSGVPIFSLYGGTRRLRPEWIDRFDVLLFDLQDVGVRVYTFLTTLGYLLEDLAGCATTASCGCWTVPTRRAAAVEGLTLQPGQESFVGLAPLPMQHGLTLGECACWYRRFSRSGRAAGGGADARLGSARAVAGTAGLAAAESEHAVAGDGARLPRHRAAGGHDAERGPRHDAPAVAGRTPAGRLVRGEAAPGGPLSRSCWPAWCCATSRFEPTFHKHAGQACPGFELVTADPVFDPVRCRPYRLITAILRIVRELHPDLPLWRDPPYEYETDRLPIDVIAGGPALRRWVDGADGAIVGCVWDDRLQADERAWAGLTEPFRRY